MRTVLCAIVMAAFAIAASNDSPTGPRITPPTISVVSPQGVARALKTTTIDAERAENAENPDPLHISVCRLRGLGV